MDQPATPAVVTRDDLALAELAFTDDLVDWRRWCEACEVAERWNESARQDWLEYVRKHGEPTGKRWMKGR